MFLVPGNPCTVLLLYLHSQFKMRYKFLMYCLALTGMVRAQHLVTGRVHDAETFLPIENARLILFSGEAVVAKASSDRGGYFQLEIKERPDFRLEISHVSYEPYSLSLSPDSLKPVQVYLAPIVKVSDEIVVAATRANKFQPSTYTDISGQEIKKSNFGQDLPFLLGMVPGAVINSDAGAGIGYTGIRIRGVDPSRINVTINGIPVNDQESHGVFWVNMPDFASSVQNIQVQRGAGTSTNGAGAFGASINLQTNSVKKDAYAEVMQGFGSYNTWRSTVLFGTGLTEQGWSFEGRLSRITSDGFIDRASSNLRSFYLSGAHYGKKSVLKANVFGGHEITYQAWNGVPEPRFRNDEAGMMRYAGDVPLDPEHLLNSGSRTYNAYTYPNEVDNYQQTHYQLHYSYQLSRRLMANLSLHYTRGRGYFEQYRQDEKLSSYGLPEVITGQDTVRRTDLARRRWLDNDFYGTVYSLSYRASDKLQLIFGGGYNVYEGDHFGEITWARFASNSQPGTRYYNNYARKSDLNFYAKASYAFTPKFQGYLDLQYRGIDYSFEGLDDDGGTAPSRLKFSFFNPKGGLVYFLPGDDQLYFSYSQANREPLRNDLVDNLPASRPTSEKLHDLELGYRFQRRNYFLQANAYYMNYKNQLILTGKVNDVGAPTHVNVPESYRAGLELEASFNLFRFLQWNISAGYSRNRTSLFTEIVADWEGGPQQENVYRNTRISFSPDLVAASFFRFKVIKNMEIDWINRYVSRQYLDNTESVSRSLDAFWVSDLRMNYLISGFYHFKEIRVSMLVNNIFDKAYAPNGYTYSGILGGERRDYNFFFPQAGTNALVQLSFSF
jgi:iron complex outermembrane receptor protein